MGRSKILAILLALGSGKVEAQADTVVDQPPDEEVAALQAAVVDRFVLSRTQTMQFDDCPATTARECSIVAFIPQQDDAECHYAALVTERIITASGEPAFVHLTRLVVEPLRITLNGKSQAAKWDRRGVAVNAALIFASPGFHEICFRESDKTDEIYYRLYHVPDLTDDGDPIDIKRVSDVDWQRLVMGGLFGGILGNRNPRANGAAIGAALDTSTEDRLPYFQRPFRIFSDAVGCTLTGCPEKLAVSVTVLGEVGQLPIFQNKNPTPYKTDATIMVPRNQLQSLSVKYPDGTSQMVIACSKLQETRVSASFLCTKSK